MNNLLRIIILACTIAITIVSLNAQTQVINGKVVNSGQQPITGVAVVLQTHDSVYVNATVTDTSGFFNMEVGPDRYRLILQHLFYETKELDFSGENAGTIVMEDTEHVLDEIVVKGERPVVMVVDGKLTYDVEQITKNKVVSNAYESLLQLPGVVEQNGIITLAGANKLSVIINGRPTTMNEDQLIQLLKSMPVSMIKKAEVMYSAPANYHVRGAAINLIIDRNDSGTPALQGEINGVYAQKHYENLSAGGSLLYSTPKFSTDFLYTVNTTKGRTGIDLSSFHTLNDSIYDIEQVNDGKRKQLTHNIRFGLDYNVNDKNKLGLVYTGELTPSIDNEEISTGNFSDSDNQKDGSDAMHNIDFNYSTASGLRAGLDYTFFKNPFTQYFRNTDDEGTVTSFDSESKQQIDRFRVYLDKSHTLPQKCTLNYGADLIYSKDHNYQKYQSKDGTDMSGLNTDNTIKEYIYNVYAGFEKSFSEKFSMTFSLSGEYFKLSDFDEWAVYPATEMTYVLSPSHIVQFSLSTDKTYPSYWEVQKSVSYINGYAMMLGNPLLKPYNDYAGQLTYILKNKYLFTAYCSFTPDYFAQLPYQSSEQLVLIYQTLNWKYSRSAGINLSIPFRLGDLLDSRMTLNGFNQRVRDDHFHEISFDRNKWILYSRLDNTINLSSDPDIKMEVAGFYLTPSLQGIYDLSRVWSVNAGIKWTFAGKKAELRLKGTDLFNSTVPDLKINYSGQRLNMHIIPDNRTVALSFSYKFGGYKEKDRKKVNTSRFGHE